MRVLNVDDGSRVDDRVINVGGNVIVLMMRNFIIIVKGRKMTSSGRKDREVGVDAKNNAQRYAHSI